MVAQAFCTFWLGLGLLGLIFADAGAAAASVWKLATDRSGARCTLSAAFGNGLILAFGIGLVGKSEDEDNTPPLGLVVVRPALWPIHHRRPFLVTMVLDGAYLSLQATVSADKRAVHVALPPAAAESFVKSRKLDLAVAGTVQSFELADLELGFRSLDGCHRGMSGSQRPFNVVP